MIPMSDYGSVARQITRQPCVITNDLCDAGGISYRILHLKTRGLLIRIRCLFVQDSSHLPSRIAFFCVTMSLA
jgi:hypothetical protein